MKLIIDIDEEVYKRIKDGHPESNDSYKCQDEVLYGKPYDERPQGEWIAVYSDLDYEEYQCSICGRVVIIYKNVDKKELSERYPFCNCGAQMKGGAE